jgi:Flp pilus assembly protein TadG
VPTRDQAGAATAELVVATPLLLLLVLGVIQFALWQHAEHVVTAAAQEGVRAARLQGGTAAGGQVEAESFLAQLGSHLVTDPRVIAQRDGAQARVEVDGRVEAVIPFLHLPVRAVSAGPVEAFQPATGGP